MVSQNIYRVSCLYIYAMLLFQWRSEDRAHRSGLVCTCYTCSMFCVVFCGIAMAGSQLSHIILNFLEDFVYIFEDTWSAIAEKRGFFKSLIFFINV